MDLSRVAWKELRGILRVLAREKAVIFDLRGYPTDAGYALLPHLMDAPEHDRWMHVPRFVGPFGALAGWEDLGWDLRPRSPRLRGRVAFLTDGRAISYAESVMGYVADLHLARIFGGPTAGTNGNINTLTLPTGLQVIFTGMRVTRHDGAPFHLQGVQPTDPVQPTLEGLRAGRDEVLQAALAWAESP